MKKVLIVTRPVDNAGDWLITERLIALTSQVANEAFKSVQVDFSPATQKQSVEFYNSYDAIVAGGGPIADDRLLDPAAFHLMSVLEEVNVPTSLIGIGWYGRTPKPADVCGGPLFSEQVRQKLSLLNAGGGGNHEQGMRHPERLGAKRHRFGYDRMSRVVCRLVRSCVLATASRRGAATDRRFECRHNEGSRPSRTRRHAIH